MPAQRQRSFREDGGRIGRDKSSDWVLPHNKVSSRHAVISYRSGVFYIEDRSRNGVFLNSTTNRLTPGRPQALQSGDVLFIEPYEIQVTIAEEVGDSALSFERPEDPFAGRPLAVAPPSFDPAFPSAEPIAGSEAPAYEGEVDPLKLLGGSGGSPARPTPPRDVIRVEDLERRPMAGHYQPPPIVAPPTPPPAPTPPPMPSSAMIPEDYDPLADAIVPDKAEGATPPAPYEPPVRAAAAPVPVVPPSPPDIDPFAPEPQLEMPAPIVERPAPKAVTPARRDVVRPTPPPPKPAPAVVAVPPAAPLPVTPAAPPPAPIPEPPPIAVSDARVEVRSPEPVAPPAALPVAPPGVAAAPTPAPHAPPPAGEAVVDLTSVLAGAGLTNVQVTPELAESFGRILTVVVSGVMDLLRARQQVKDELRMRQTQFRPADNNPLKFSANVEDALHNLLVKRNPAYLKPVDAFSDAFDDLRDHQLAMLAGLRVAFEAMLNEFDPARLEEQFDRQLKKGSLLSVPAKLRYWDAYRERTQQLLRDMDSTFRKWFGEEFVKAYEEQLERLEAERGGPTP
jgi:type VI secretion system FHA domain protein